MKQLFVVLVMLFSTTLLAQDMNLPLAEKEGGMPLMEALNQRQSSRSFTTQKLTMQQLSNLLWAAWGYNRGITEKRTAPSSRNFQEMQIYVALESGLYLYDAKAHRLLQQSDKDLRGATGEQDFVATAALNLVYVANYADDERCNEDNNLQASFANTGFISQNVYLYCTSAGLATVVRGWFVEEELKEVMGLSKENRIILCQTVGYAQ